MPAVRARSIVAPTALAVLACLTATAVPAQDRTVVASSGELGTASADARNHFQQGLDDLYNIFGARAATHFDKALEADPAYALARAIRAATTPGLGDAERRVEMERAIRDAAGAPTAQLLAIMSWRATDPKERRALLEALHELAPTDAAVAYRLANQESDPARRTTALRQVSQEFPDFAPVHNILAYALWDAGEREAAMRAVREYVRLAPDHPNSYDSYAELLQRGKRYDEALQQYQMAVAKAPDFAEAHAGIAELRLLDGKPEEARTAWRQAIALATPNQKAGYAIQLAGSYLLEGNRKMALQELEAARGFADVAGQNGLAAQADAMMGVVEANAGNGAAVTGHIEAATRRAPDAPGPKAWSAVAYSLAGDIASARAIATALAAQSASGGAGQAALSHRVNAIVAAAAGEIDLARAELAQVTGGTLLEKAMLAEALGRAGKKAEARTLRDEIMTDPEVSMAADLARVRMKTL